MSNNIQIADLDDEPDKVYIFGYPHGLSAKDAQKLKETLETAFQKASIVTVTADIDTDFAVEEMGEGAVQDLLDYAEAMEGVNRD